MNKEEIEAIENIDWLVHCLNYGEKKMTIASERQKEIAQELQTLLNLIDNQQKEIEELKKPKYIYNAETNELKPLYNDFISKDKIREALDDGYWEAKGYGCEDGANIVIAEIEKITGDLKIER